MKCRVGGMAFAIVAAGVLAVGTVASGPFALQADAAPSLDAAAGSDVYSSQVQPIFKSDCYKCHAGMFHRGAFKLDTPADILKGGHSGAAIVPGHPDQSLLIKLIRHEGPPNHPMPMPPHSKLSDEDIATVEKWIQGGAVMPGTPAAQPLPGPDRVATPK